MIFLNERNLTKQTCVCFLVFRSYHMKFYIINSTLQCWQFRNWYTFSCDYGCSFETFKKYKRTKEVHNIPPHASETSESSHDHPVQIEGGYIEQTLDMDQGIPGMECTGWVKQNVPSDKICHYCTISWDKWRPDVYADSRYKNYIYPTRYLWVMSAWKRRTSFAPTQGLHFSSLWNVLSDMITLMKYGCEQYGTK